jgi:hypothetical protein
MSDEEYHFVHVKELTDKQAEAVREFATEEGYESLAGYSAYLRSVGWDYYDVLKMSCRE